MKSKLIFSVAVLSFVFAIAQAQTQLQEYKYKNDIRFGIGDMLFETLIWHNQEHKDYSGAEDPDGKGFPENTRYRHTPHFSLDYSYRVLPWLSVGGTMDIQGTFWNRETYSNENKLMSVSSENFYNLCIMPRVRFHYFRRPNVELYSAIAAGIDINGGTEVNGFGQNTVCGMAAEINLIGVMAGKDHWFGFFDLGALFGMKGTNNIFMMGSQLMKAGVAYRF